MDLSTEETLALATWNTADGSFGEDRWKRLTTEDAAPKDPRVHTAALMLRLCGRGEATRLLRTLLPTLTQGFAEELDAATEATLENLCPVFKTFP